MAYPRHYHNAVNALIAGQHARDVLANSLRQYRQAGDREAARKLLSHAAWIGFPVRLRPNGRYR